MVRARVDQKTFMAFMIPFLLTIATAGLLLLAVYSSPDPDNSILVDILLNLWMISLYAWLPIFIVLGIAFVYMGWYPPTFFKKKDPFLCRSDWEKWAAAAGYLPLLELHASLPDTVEDTGLVGGGRPAPHRRKRYRAFLSTNFHITDRESGLAALERLAASRQARDLCWGVLIAGMLFVCRWLKRDELNDWYGRFMTPIQDQFHSWTELNLRFQEEESAAGMDDESVQVLRKAVERERNGLYQVRFL
ncbi:hypothetical protein [Intestinimonas sp.]|uniref:hypothetical protein n=1 Tax=Intestinimonas sp. TaxID=1965293 RepID=UPI00260E98F1|nr:hypothetical protein [Intestinimonas sp.]